MVQKGKLWTADFSLLSLSLDSWHESQHQHRLASFILLTHRSFCVVQIANECISKPCSGIDLAPHAITISKAANISRALHSSAADLKMEQAEH
jgi:hypothetical protein